MKTEDIKQLAAAWAEVQEKAAKQRQEQAEAMLAQEGKLPPALQAYMDKKKGKKSDDKEDDDGEDKKSDAKPDFLDLDKDGDKKEPMKKAAADKKMKKESTEVNELSKKTLGSYIKRASSDNAVNNMAKGMGMAYGNDHMRDQAAKLAKKRKAGIATAVDKMVKKEAMDPVDKKELKGKHKDRKDKDIDNDGDVDSSDKFLHKRRKAISKDMKENTLDFENMADEEFDEILEAAKSPEELEELIGAIARGAGSLVKKAGSAVGSAVASRVTTAGRADRAQAKLKKMKTKVADRKKLDKAKAGIAALKKTNSPITGKPRPKPITSSKDDPKEVEVAEDITHQTVKPPNHMKKYSNPKRGDGAEKKLTSDQLAAHGKAAKHHSDIADGHKQAMGKAKSSNVKQMHAYAVQAHKKAADGHNSIASSPQGRTIGAALSSALSKTRNANDQSQSVRTHFTKKKRVNEVQEAAQPKWKVAVGNTHYTVTARNTAEASRKAGALAKKAGNNGVGGKIEKVSEAATHKPNNGSDPQQGLSPKGKEMMAMKTDGPEGTDITKVAPKTFAAMRASGKKAAMRNNDNPQGDKTPPKNDGK